MDRLSRSSAAKYSNRSIHNKDLVDRYSHSSAPTVVIYVSECANQDQDPNQFTGTGTSDTTRSLHHRFLLYSIFIACCTGEELSYKLYFTSQSSFTSETNQKTFRTMRGPTIWQCLLLLSLTVAGTMAQNPPCPICGEGLTLTNAQGIVDLGSTGTLPCAQLESIGLQGGIPERSCLPIQQLSQEPCGCEVLTGAPTSTPAPTALATEAPSFQPTFTPAPTNNPTGTPTFPPAPECWDDLDAIFAREISLSPELVLAEPRTYVLCPNTNYFMGNDPGRNFQFQTGFASLIGRPNVHYKCGDSGSSANNCRLLSGSYPIALLDPFDTVNTNVTFQGLTIESSFEFGMLVSKPGDVLLLDCIFRVSPPIFGLHHDPASLRSHFI